MARLVLDKVGVSFALTEQQGLSLRSHVAQRVGATLSRSASGITSVDALVDISLDLRDGDRLGLLGHNGAGKSTLLKVCTGIYEPTSGHILREGRVASMTDFLMGLDPDLPGHENIVRRGVFMGLSPAQARAMIPEVEAFCELGDFMKLPMRTYSTGMSIRLAFAIATTVEPDILIMDEMINAGDMSFMERSNARMQALVSRSRILVLASHDAALLARVCTRGVVLQKGRIVFEGPIADAIASYEAGMRQG
jgi:ABC-2 type transport system ATP-binding protein/lipopolysaccharide transport system ATP-binding protein